MSKFYRLQVSRVIRETADCVVVEFDLDAESSAVFTYQQGQYLTFRLQHNGAEIRRSYSICSSPYTGEKLKVAIKEVENGIFSTYANRQLQSGEYLEAMPPMGNFYTPLASTNRKNYVGFAAGSGITPLMSIIKSVIKIEPESTFHLVYGNRDTTSTIFKAELDALMDTHKALRLTYLFSRQNNGDKLFEGRIDETKCNTLIGQFSLANADEFFICGPEEMILSASDALKKAGVDKKKVHYELFTTPVKLKTETVAEVPSNFDGVSNVTVIMDGAETSFKLPAKGINLLDAAIDAGVDAPYSCKGAVCCTCKAKVLEGKASMNMNYALSEEEVQAGFVLTCQAHPLTEKLVVDFDV